jgi:hypothetical protein
MIGTIAPIAITPDPLTNAALMSRPDPMQGLEVLLLHPFDGHKAHGGLGHGFTDGFGIAGIVLRRLHIGFDKLWGDQPHVVAMLAKTPGPVMGTPTGFHPNAERWYIRNKGQQFTAGDALPEHHSTCVIHPTT